MTPLRAGDASPVASSLHELLTTATPRRLDAFIRFDEEKSAA